MTGADFVHLCAFLRERSGLSLGADKVYLAQSRLEEVRRRFGITSYADLVLRLRLGHDADLADAVVEAMTTNETFFFRDKTAFELLRHVLLPRAVERRRESRRIRIWSAAAASGQEAYSLAMLVHGMSRELGGYAVEIVATDISSEMIARARAGRYSQREVQRGLPIQLLLKHFAKTGQDWTIAESLRRSIRFDVVNLTKPFQRLGPFDIVLCRNVLIYFDQDTKRQVLDGLAGVLQPDGAVLFGGADAPLGSTDALVPEGVHATVFVRPPTRPSAPTRRLSRPPPRRDETSPPRTLSRRESPSGVRLGGPGPGTGPREPLPGPRR